MSDMSDRQLLREAEDEAPWGAEEKRLREIRTRRRAQGECILCGRPLGFFDKRARRAQHKDCEHFRE